MSTTNGRSSSETVDLAEPEMASLSQVLADWAADLRYSDIPERIISYATSELISHLAVVRASMGHPLGRRLVRAFGSPLVSDPIRASYALAALSACLYYEDSLYVGHVSHSTVNVPLAYRGVQRLTGRQLLAAVVAANECAARVTAAATLGPLRGQGTAYTQLVGAVAARLHGAGTPAPRWVDAWGLALAAPPWPLRRAFFGSDAKVLFAATAVHTGLSACDAAEAGLTGAPDILEHPGGLLAKFAQVPCPEVVTAGLGVRWHTETLTFKTHPAGAYVDATIDCAIELHHILTRAEIADIAEITVSVARLTMVMDRDARPYLSRERSAIAALNMSVAYNVATALLTGAVRPADLAAPATADPERWALAERVRVVYDPECSARLLRATAPLGEALRQAGVRADEWLAGFSGGRVSPGFMPDGGPSVTFENATKAVGARVMLRLRDGRELTATRDRAAGSAGPRTRADHRAIARHKLLTTGVPAELADRLDEVDSAGHEDLDTVIRAALSGSSCPR